MLSIYRIVAWVYFAAPLVALAWTVHRARSTGSVKRVRTAAGLIVGSLFLSIAIVLLRVLFFGGSVPYGQVFRAWYWSIALLWIIRALNGLSQRLFTAIATSRWLRQPEPEHAEPGARYRWAQLTLLAIAALTRALLVVALGTALLLATFIGYRPGTVHGGNPQTILHAPFENVVLHADDGTRLSAWWIAASDDRSVATNGSDTTPRAPVRNAIFGEAAPAGSTIILCPGLGSDKAEQLPVVRELYAAGYNVLAIDLRAHGESGGSISTFGNLERLDVLAAVHWLRTQHPADARRIFGLGINIGASALLGAAADHSEDGQAIDAIAAIEPFDDAGNAMAALGKQHGLPSVGWLAGRIAWPALRCEFGVAFGPSPAANVTQLWPRPLLVIEGDGNGLVPVEQARQLFEAAYQPKYAWWADEKNTRQILFKDKRTPLALRAFFGGARSIL